MSVRIEFNDSGFRQLLASEEVKGMIEGHVAKIKGRADAGMSETDTRGFNGKTVMGRYKGGRWLGVVGTSDLATMIAESEQKTLTKAVHG